MSDESNNIFKKFQEFLTHHGDQYDTVEAAMIDFIQSLQDKDHKTYHKKDIPQIQSIDLVEKSFFTDNERERQNLLRRALEIWPDNIDAKLHLIDEDNAVDYLNALEDLWISEKSKIDVSNFQGWADYSQKPYWRLCHSLALTYNAFGLLLNAQEIYEYILLYNPKDPMNTRFELMTIYCRTYNWAKAMDLFLQDPAHRQMDRMLIPLLVLAISLHKEELAKEYMDNLYQCNPDVDLLMDDDEEQFDMEMIVELSQSEDIEINSLESSALAFAPFVSQMAGSAYLYYWFDHYFDEEDQINISDKVISISFPGSKLARLNRERQNIFKGIPSKQESILKAYGLVSHEDFLQTREEEVLKIKFIGPATIQKLKENGVTFFQGE